MKRKTTYVMTDTERHYIYEWLNDKYSWRELGDLLGFSHENVRIAMSQVLKCLYEEGHLIIKK